MSDIGQLVVKIAGDASQLQKELDKIADGGTRAAASMERAGKIMAGALLAAASAAIYMTVQAGKTAEEIEQMSTITGIATDKLQGYQVLLARTGLTNQDMAMGFKTLSTNIVEAQNQTSKAAQSFEKLGLSIQSNAEPSQVLRDIADRLSTMPDGFEKSALATELFGRAGQSMLKAFKGGAAALDEAAKKAQEFGLVLTKEGIDKLTRMDDAIDDMGSAWKGFSTQLGVFLAPAVDGAVNIVTSLITKLTDVVKGFNEATTASEGFAKALIALNKATGGTNAPTPTPKGPLASPPVDEQTLAAIEALQVHVITQEELGLKIRDKAIAQYRTIEAQKRAEEALGRVLVDIAKREFEERKKLAAVNVVTDEDLKGQAILERTQAIQKSQDDARKREIQYILQRNELSAMFGSTLQEQLTQEQLGAKIVAESVVAHQQRFQALEDEAKEAQVNLDMQKELFKQDSILSNKVGLAREAAMKKIDADERLARAKANEDIIGDEVRLQAELARIRGDAEVKRMAVAREFPTFWEKQLDDIANSNVFSMAQMVSTWSNSIATMIVKGGDLQAAIDATLIAVVQAFVNMAVAAGASALKAALFNQAAATAAATAWEGAAAAITGTFAAIGSAIVGLWTELIVPVFVAIGNALMDFLAAIAEAAADTIFGIPYAAAILAGIVLIGGAIAALTAVKLAEGGIVTGPTFAMIGEAGPEAVIPLDKAGALGGASDTVIQNNIYLDGHKITQVVTRHQPRAMRKMGVPA